MILEGKMSYLKIGSYRLVIAIFLFWPDYGVILEGKMSYLEIGKRQHLNIKNFGKKNYELFLNVYWNISRGCAYFFLFDTPS